jgi:glutathione synthase/RimK-type ligase-like ATP-grasp enzyme
MIGILFSPIKLSRIAIKREEKENTDFYFQLAKEYAIDLLFYTPKDLLESTDTVEGYVYRHRNEQWSRQRIPLPRVNLIRTMLQNSAVHDKIRELELQNVVFINKTKGRNKDKINQYLNTMEVTSSYIPDSINFSFRNMLIYLKRYGKVIIKPVNGSFGERIVKVEKREAFYYVHYIHRRRQHKRVFLSTRRLFLFFRRLYKRPSIYMLQQWIDFKQYEGSSLDIRTSVQKNENGQWALTGIVARVAKKDGIVTNVAQGGKVVRFADIYRVLDEIAKEQLYELSLLLGKQLEMYNPQTADLGLDIGIDEKGKLWFIEANYCDERYAYRESSDYDMWFESYRVPFSYAYHRYLEVDKENSV